MSGLVYLNGDWIAPEAAKVSVFDRGFLFAEGIYEVVPVYHRRPFLAEHHLARLTRSLEAIGIEAPGQAFWLALVDDLIANNPSIESGLVYFQVTRGAESKRNHLPQGPMTPTIFATFTPMQLHWDTPAPAKVTLCDDIRWLRCDIKSVSLLGNQLLKQEAQRRGAIEPLLHRDGRITEGASSNYFAVKQGELYTAPADHLILAGITRMWVIELAQRLGLQVNEQPFHVAELGELDELFLTSSSREVQPIGQIDDIIVADGRCGKVTQQLIDAFHASKREHIA
ncbi:aminotransferase class IV [Pseudidiomarina sediminum]|uniref:aminotransferase class IV n=1 Tax=Pseudidiomarina sediminum TaxID=431675 RepID=UPI001C93E5F6|nr:aminotransferase class IV [Pseudidiomarina sediminum]MBY6063435.1 aminotransferase class IV [Pseudidiomarina sediminum]